MSQFLFFPLLISSSLLPSLIQPRPHSTSPLGWSSEFEIDSIPAAKSVDVSYSADKPIRCGKIDGERRSKRYVTNKHKWKKTKLRWRFRDPDHLFSGNGDYTMVRKTIQRALDMWSQASAGYLTFFDISDEANSTETDLDIFFARWDHGDHEPFDGRGGIVAHSGYPMEGKVHFDASELWTINGQRGIDLRYVTLHELGHALGLKHSEKEGAIMHPIYSTPFKRLALSADDIRGIRHLYRPHHRRHHHHKPTSPIKR